MINNIFKELKTKRVLSDLALKSYNAAAQRMNDGIIEAFNKACETKGMDFSSKAYDAAYSNLFNKVWTQEIKKLNTKFTVDEIKKAWSLFKIIIK